MEIVNTVCGFLCLASAFFYQGKKKSASINFGCPEMMWKGMGGAVVTGWPTPLSSDCVTRFLHLLAACIEFGKWSSCGWNSAMLFLQLLCRIVTLFSPPCLLLLTIWPHFGSPVLWWKGSWTVHCLKRRRIPQKALPDKMIWSFAPSCCFKRGVDFVFSRDFLFFTNLCSLPLWRFQQTMAQRRGVVINLEFITKIRGCHWVSQSQLYYNLHSRYVKFSPLQWAFSLGILFSDKYQNITSVVNVILLEKMCLNLGLPSGSVGKRIHL